MNATVSVVIAATSVFVLSAAYYMVLTPVEVRALGPAAPDRDCRHDGGARAGSQRAARRRDSRRGAGGRSAQCRLHRATRVGIVARVPVRAAHGLDDVGERPHRHRDAARGGLAAQAARDLSGGRALAMSPTTTYQRDPRVDESWTPCPAGSMS